LPRRYHRPPAVKRRKTRRPGSPGTIDDVTGTENGVSTDVSTEDLSAEEWDGDSDVEDSTSMVGVATDVTQEPARDHTRHIQRDYSYVRSELMRIATMAVIIVLGLGVVAIIR